MQPSSGHDKEVATVWAVGSYASCSIATSDDAEGFATYDTTAVGLNAPTCCTGWVKMAAVKSSLLGPVEHHTF